MWGAEPVGWVAAGCTRVGRNCIDSERGRGSVFTLVVPMAAQREPRGAIRRIATVSVNNERVAALVATLLEGFEVECGAMPSPASMLWISDDAASAEAVGRFVAADPRGRAILMSDAPVEADARIVRIAAHPRPGEIREAIGRVLAGEVQG